EVTNELPITEALIKMSYMLYDMGRAFAEHFPAVEMVVIPGNHPRIQKKPRYKDKWNNWEWAMGEIVRAHAKDEFKVTVPKEMVYRHRVFDQVLGMTHGDGVRSNSFAGIPFYGMKQRRDALQALFRSLKQQQIDMMIMGHFHQFLFEKG